MTYISSARLWKRITSPVILIALSCILMVAIMLKDTVYEEPYLLDVPQVTSAAKFEGDKDRAGLLVSVQQPGQKMDYDKKTDYNIDASLSSKTVASNVKAVNRQDESEVQYSSSVLSESVIAELNSLADPIRLKGSSYSIEDKKKKFPIQTMEEPFEYPTSIDYTKFPRPPRSPPPNRGEPGSESYYSNPEQYKTTKLVNTTAYKARTCSAITGRRVLMNYAHNCCKKSQPLNCKTGLENGVFDFCFQFNQESLDEVFLEQAQNVIKNRRMAGYGVWKPYLILRLLVSLDDDDVLFYSDSGAEIVKPLEDYFCLMDELNQDAVVFSVGLPEDQYTKGDAFLAAGCYSKECVYSQQRMGTFSMFRKSMFSINFLSMWLTLNQDLRVASDDPSIFNMDVPSFKMNRHDQTSLSLASKRFGLPDWPEPSQWGEHGFGKMLRDKPKFKKIAKTVINHTRNKS